jgi:glucose-6-phosphate dehydrogenase assembly protein OpcA
VEDAVSPPIVSPETVLRELADLWVATGKDGPNDTGAGVLKACSMTLIAVAEAAADAEDAAGLGETIAALMPDYPARTILVRLSGPGEPVLSERVYAQCWLPFGERRQICCEHIEITVSDAYLPDLRSLLPPLAAPDLPVILWCRSARLFDSPEIGVLAGIARKVIVDSTILPDARAALARLAAMAGGGALLGDLSWTQLTRWREIQSRIFENREYLARLPEVDTVRVAFAGPQPPVHAWYMGAWSVDALAGVGVHTRLRLEPDAALAGRALRIELAGQDFRMSLERREDRLVTRVGDASQCVSLPRPTDYMLMREELGIVRHDPVYERTLASAAKLAVSFST